MSNPSRRVVLHPDVPRRRFEELAAEQDWRLLGVSPQEEILPAEWIYEVTPHDTVSYIEDRLHGCSYVVAVGPERARVARMVARALPHHDHRALLARWDAARTEDDTVLATHALGIGAPETSDDDFMARMALALRDPRPAVRLAGVRAVAATRWDVFHAALSWIAANDPDAEVRQLADGVAEAMEIWGDPPRPG